MMKQMPKTKLISQVLIPLVAVLCLWPAVPSAAALFAGIVIAVSFGNPYLQRTRALTPKLLSYSVIGLGAGMNLLVVAHVGGQGFLYTAVGISCTLAFGIILAKILEVEQNTSLLITAGTAICGGSAIAALGPVIRAKPHEMSLSLATVFLLNAVGLLIFPWLGHYFELSQSQFGLWSALAIHDTSSVVGATIQYGTHALEVGTTVKLARALWIIPVTIGMSFIGRDANETIADANGGRPKAKKPYFILEFLLAAAIVTWIPATQVAGDWVAAVARRTLVVTLFLIGAGFDRETLRLVSPKPFILGVILWVLVAVLTLLAVLSGLIYAN
jgi:uncharacterized integral membrane protein (TIGR00698 family)